MDLSGNLLKFSILFFFAYFPHFNTWHFPLQTVRNFPLHRTLKDHKHTHRQQSTLECPRYPQQPPVSISPEHGRPLQQHAVIIIITSSSQQHQIGDNQQQHARQHVVVVLTTTPAPLSPPTIAHSLAPINATLSPSSSSTDRSGGQQSAGAVAAPVQQNSWGVVFCVRMHHDENVSDRCRFLLLRFCDGGAFSKSGAAACGAEELDECWIVVAAYEFWRAGVYEGY